MVIGNSNTPLTSVDPLSRQKIKATVVSNDNRPVGLKRYQHFSPQNGRMHILFKYTWNSPGIYYMPGDRPVSTNLRG